MLSTLNPEGSDEELSEEKTSHTVAWIGAAAVVIAAVITATATIADGDDKRDTAQPEDTTSSVTPSAETDPDEATSEPEMSGDPSASASTKPDSGRVFAPLYTKRVTLQVAADRNMTVVDLDRPKTAAMLEDEWDDGTSARLGYDFGLRGTHTLYTAVPWKLSSAAGAPTRPAECLEAARTNMVDTWLAAEALGAGEVICFETSDGNVARATFVNYVDRVSTTFEITVWK